MKREIIVAGFLLLLLAGCAHQAEPAVTAATSEVSGPTRTPPPTATSVVTATEAVTTGEPVALLPMEQGRFFSASGNCAICHTDLTDENGTDISIVSDWRSTMMANAARDPYWQAMVERETLINPAMSAVVEDQCATCHMPAGHFSAQAEGDETRILSRGFLNQSNRLHTLALDGVSCTVCHQIAETNLGFSSSYGGGYVIDNQSPMGERSAYGPHTIDDEYAGVMQAESGFKPTWGAHVLRSEYCATCHTLYWPTIDSSGQLAGDFPGQMVYFEWYYSDYRRSQSCQSCHMPEESAGVRISSVGSPLRSPFSRHEFIGGNSYMLNVLRTFGDEIGVTASRTDFDVTLGRTNDQLATKSTSINFESVEIIDAWLRAKVRVENLSGHKFPTGYPGRRVWIHLTIRDADGQMVCESGGYNQNGAIIGNDNDQSESGFEPHYEQIVRPDQVQVYESIIGDSEGEVTTVLLHSASYLKDNRLLPDGFDKEQVYSGIAVRGQAREDENFIGGSDEILYVLDVGQAKAPFTVTVELLYQSLGYRWINDLRMVEGTRIARFLDYSDTISNQPIIAFQDSTEVSR